MTVLIPGRFTFPHLMAPHAQRVAVVGPFNGWDAAAQGLTKTPGGDWRITVFLPPGRVVYCFSIDGDVPPRSP
jgi:1,4-alpha-glucan branching enzyme